MKIAAIKARDRSRRKALQNLTSYPVPGLIAERLATLYWLRYSNAGRRQEGFLQVPSLLLTATMGIFLKYQGLIACSQLKFCDVTPAGNACILL